VLTVQFDDPTDWLGLSQSVRHGHRAKDVPGVGGELVLTNNDVDVRGQRPLANGSDDVWPFEANGVPRATGLAESNHFFSSADRNSVGKQSVSRRRWVYTGNQAKRAANQPARRSSARRQSSITWKTPPVTSSVKATSCLKRSIPSSCRYFPGYRRHLRDGIDVSRNKAFGGAELLHNFFFAGFGNLEFPLGSVPAGWLARRTAAQSRDDEHRCVRRDRAEGFRHKQGPAWRWPNLNTGGFLGPLDSSSRYLAGRCGSPISADSSRRTPVCRWVPL